MNAARLRSLPASRIIASIASAAERWADADFPPRVRATRAIEERLRYSEPVVDYALDRLFRPVTVPALRAVIENELGAIEALDGFVARPHRPDAFARGADMVTIVSSDSTIGVACWPAIFALCAKSAVVVKDRSDALLSAFAQTLREEDEAFGDAFAAERWDGHDDPLARQRLVEADVVLAFGRDASLQAVRERCRAGARFFGYGHRTSVAYVEARPSAHARLTAARALARDALLYDGDGCLSVHCTFIEGTIEEWREPLAQAFDEASVEFPPVLSSASRARAEFVAAQSGGALEPARTYVLTIDPEFEAPPPFHERSLAVRFVDGPAPARRYLERHALPIEAFGLLQPSSAQPEVTALALCSGAARIARIGDLQSPALESNHGGDGRIAPFIEWVVRDRD